MVVLVPSVGNHPAIASYLLSLDADSEARTAYKMTPLHVAAFYGSKDVIRLLLEHVEGINVDALDFGSCERRAREGMGGMGRILYMT